MKFKVLRADRAADKTVTEGAEVFKCNKHDYGCARDDTNGTGIEYISVTFAEDGDYPFFTIPREDLEAV